MTVLTLQWSVWATVRVRSLSPPLCHTPTSTGPGVTHPYPQKALPSQAFLLQNSPQTSVGEKRDRSRPRDVQNLHLSMARWGGRHGAAAGDLWLPPALMFPAPGRWDRGAGDSHSAPVKMGKGGRKSPRRRKHKAPLSPFSGKCELWALWGPTSWVGMAKSSIQPSTLRPKRLKVEPKRVLCPLAKSAQDQGRSMPFYWKPVEATRGEWEQGRQQDERANWWDPNWCPKCEVLWLLGEGRCSCCRNLLLPLLLASISKCNPSWQRGPTEHGNKNNF